jgi:hypothetical protein
MHGCCCAVHDNVQKERKMATRKITERAMFMQQKGLKEERSVMTGDYGARGRSCFWIENCKAG